MKIWSGDCKNQLERLNMKLDEDNGKTVGMVNGRDHKVQQFSSN